MNLTKTEEKILPILFKNKKYGMLKKYAKEIGLSHCMVRKTLCNIRKKSNINGLTKDYIDARSKELYEMDKNIRREIIKLFVDIK